MNTFNYDYESRLIYLYVNELTQNEKKGDIANWKS